MKKSSMLLFIAALFTLGIAQQKTAVKQPQTKPAAAEEQAPGKFTGMIFNDLTYAVNEPQTIDVSKSTSGNLAFVFRRATIGYQYAYNSDVAAVIVYDASSNVLKQGNVQVRNIVSHMDLKIGLMQTLSSEGVEKIWKYRSLEASVLDRKRMTQEFDMGLTFTGRSDAQGTLYGRLAVYNGTGTAPENNKLKKLALSAGSWMDKTSLLELYVDYENVGSGRSIINGKAFFGMNAADLGFGVEGFYSMYRKFAVTKDVVPAGASLFGWFELMRSLRGVARIDVVDNDLNQSVNVYREVYFNGGLDYAPVAEVHLIPNIVYVKNLKKGTGTGIADVIYLRLTTSVYFK
jgi:hypothetical protein